MSLDTILSNLTPEERQAADLRAAAFGRKIETSPRVIFLVGVPGSGKSTWREKYLASTTRDTVTISSDDMVMAYAKVNGLDYTQAHREIDMNALDKQCAAALRVAVAKGQDVIIDRTNLRFKPRRRFLSQVSKRYVPIAIAFWVDCPELRQRLDKRAASTGKHIPWKVVMEMFEGYQPPTFDEFDVIEIYP